MYIIYTYVIEYAHVSPIGLIEYAHSMSTPTQIIRPYWGLIEYAHLLSTPTQIIEYAHVFPIDVSPIHVGLFPCT